MTELALHPFDQAVALQPTSENRFRGRTSEAYWNMISPFGGVTAAIMLNGALSHPKQEGDPVALTVNYAAPIQQGDFHVESRLMRANRSTQHWSIVMTQGEADEVVANAVAVFGVRRETWGSTEAVRPSSMDRESSRRFRPIMNMRWPAMYDIRYALGEVREGNVDSITHSWISDATPRNVDFLSLAAYCDTFAPRIFMRRAQFVPIGTVSLNIYFHVSGDDLAQHGSEPVFGVAQGQVSHKAYYDQHGQVWGKGNELLATTHQMAWYKE